MSGAIISECGLFRYTLTRDVQAAGMTIGFFGVNPSTAGPLIEDQTTTKWRGFTVRNGGRRYIAGNPFAFRSTDVKQLAAVPDPVGPLNWHFLESIIRDSDILVPCWGDRSKVPQSLHRHFDELTARLLQSGKPVRIFGLTKAGDPKHPLMLGYDTPLIPW